MEVSSAVADSIFNSISIAASVTDSQLSILHFLYGKNLERALRIVDLSGVKRIVGEPRGRALFLVVGESKRKEEYICFPTHHCTCYSFFYDVVNRFEQLCCKHQLAARFAEAVCAYTESKVPDEELAMKLLKPIDLFQFLLKDGKMNKGRLLGLDVGTKYVGLAVSDENNVLASPLSVLRRKKSNIKSMAEELQALVEEYSLAGLVVGCPYNLMGCDNPQVAQIKLFVHCLRQTGQLDGLNYAYWDERFTSKSVELLLKPLNLHPMLYKTVLDKFAAVAILQGFLDFANKNLKQTYQLSQHKKS